MGTATMRRLLVTLSRAAGKSLLGGQDQMGEEFGKVIIGKIFQEFYHHGGKSERVAESRCGIKGASFFKKKANDNIFVDS